MFRGDVSHWANYVRSLNNVTNDFRLYVHLKFKLMKHISDSSIGTTRKPKMVHAVYEKTLATANTLADVTQKKA